MKLIKSELSALVAEHGLKTVMKELSEVCAQWSSSIVKTDAYAIQEANRWNRDANKVATCADTLESPI